MHAPTSGPGGSGYKLFKHYKEARADEWLKFDKNKNTIREKETLARSCRHELSAFDGEALFATEQMDRCRGSVGSLQWTAVAAVLDSSSVSVSLN